MGHRIMTSPIDANTWCDTLKDPLKDTIQIFLDQHRIEAIDFSRQVTIHEHQESDWPRAHLSLDDAFLLLKSPLELLLENERSDWAFLYHLSTIEQRKILEDALHRGALSIRQGGGINEVNKSLKALKGDDLHLRLRRLRTWVLFDRDASPDDKTQPSKQSEELRQTCEALQAISGDPQDLALSWRRLQRRSIENYLPLDAIRAHAPHAPEVSARIDALEALRNTGPHIADCIDLKEGLLKDLKKHIKELIKEELDNFYKDARSNEPAKRLAAYNRISPKNWPPPFDQLLPEQRAELLVGFGPKISDAFLIEDIDPQKFSNEFDARKDEPESAFQLINSILKEM